MAAPFDESDFVFAVCQLGAEPALKAEVAGRWPRWRFAYSRPGLVTWKADRSVGANVALGAVFASAWGASIGKAVGVAEVPTAGPVGLHVFERDRAKPGDEDETYGALAQAVRAEIVAAAPAGRFVEPRVGGHVLDVIVAPGEPLWLGFHAHGGAHSPHPGGRVPLVLPPEAPSRAWLKLEEALAWSRLPLQRGHVAVEIGSAPGGASWALVTRGLTVVGVDPGAMDARVLAAPGFSHVQVPLGDLRREQLPARVDWLLMDVNLAPQVALHAVKRIVSTVKSTLRGVIFTLKLNDWTMAAEVPALLERVAGMGLTGVRATQLASNRREICVVATRRKKP